MNATRSPLTILTAVVLLAGTLFAAPRAQAQPDRPTMFFVEGGGGFLVQIGETDYLPSASSVDFQYPLVYGFGVGGTAGVMLGENIALTARYGYGRAQTRDGSVPGVLDNVEGRIDYHFTVMGLRLFVPTGCGSVRGGLAVGVMFPHSTVLELDYGPALGQLPTPITGTGRRVENFSIGVGGVASLGYQLPIAGPFYVAADLDLLMFQTENSGETTEVENFVTDFAATPPVAVTGTIPHGDGAAGPQAVSVASASVLLALGAQF